MNLKILPTFIKGYFSKAIPKVENISNQTFTPLVFEKKLTTQEARYFAATNFRIRNINTTNLNEYNGINRLCTKIYNLTEGEILFPPDINVIKQKNSKYSGSYNNRSISLIKSNTYLETFIHELGHYNHENTTANYLKMGKRSEIKNDMLYPDYRILDDFMKDTQSLKLIRQYISNYATSSPCEFVAEMFTTIINGRKLPLELFNLYKKYDGPCYEILLKQYKKGNLVI